MKTKIVKADLASIVIMLLMFVIILITLTVFTKHNYLPSNQIPIERGMNVNLESKIEFHQCSVNKIIEI